MLIGIAAKRKLERLAGYFEGTITEAIERLIDERTLSLWTQLNDEDRDAFLEGRLTQTDFLTRVTGSVLRRSASGRKLNEALASALEREGELSLAYQPIQHLACRRCAGRIRSLATFPLGSLFRSPRKPDLSTPSVYSRCDKPACSQRPGLIRSPSR